MYNSDLAAIKAHVFTIECTQDSDAIENSLRRIIELAQKLQVKLKGDQHALHIPATKDD